MKNKVIVLIGFSASGKDSIQSALNKVGYKNCISHTTRPMRDGEQEGKEYYFIGDETFSEMYNFGQFAGSPRTYNTLVNNIPQTWHYGLSKTELNSDKNMVTILDRQGAEALKQELGDRMIGIFIDVSDDERKRRCIGRGDYNESEWNRREVDDKKAFGDIKNSDVVDLVVENYDVGKCLGDIYKHIGIKRIPVYLDVDGLILMTLDVMAEYYNTFAHSWVREPIKNITAQDIKSWNATESLVGFEPDDIEEIFKSSFFWNEVKEYQRIKNVIKKLHNTGLFDIFPTSIGSSENIAQKTIYLQKHYPFLTNQIMLVKNNGCNPGKAIINMSNGCICDDNVSNLISSNAKYRILVKFDGEDKQWSQGWDGSTVRTPEELYQEVMACWELENREGKTSGIL